ncbi:MAG: apolipoprotein N-acyltransferase, partial [Pyrinomonadaceae bacterium]
MTDSRISVTAKNPLFLISLIREIFVFPRWQDAMLSLLSAVLLILAFPNFELWFVTWFALVPMFVAIERNKNSTARSFWLGLLTGSVFYFGSCWWLTYAPIRYGGLPAPLIYLLFIPVTVAAGFFTGIFAAILARLMSKFGHYAIFLTPFIWTACELARYWLTGNAWNALGYSQAFVPSAIRAAEYGGVFLISFLLIIRNALVFFVIINKGNVLTWKKALPVFGIILLLALKSQILKPHDASNTPQESSVVVIALQPNVPMSGLTYEKYFDLRQRHVEMAEAALREVNTKPELKDLRKILVFPESPMSFQYAQDSEFREFVQAFNVRNRVSLIFNGWEPTAQGEGLTNSAVMINERGEKVAQYDKIRLVPFGEYIPQWIPFS